MAGAAVATPASWSPPALLDACAATGPPSVLFPAEAPNRATGPGAIAWPAGGACAGGAGAVIDEIRPGQIPAAPARPRSAGGARLAPVGPLAAAGGPHGRIALAGADPAHPTRLLAVQGLAGGPFTTLLRGGPVTPAVLSTAYLGDLAIAAPGSAGAVTVRIERWFGGALGAARPLAPGGPAGGQIDALTVAMDFRSDAIVAWAQGGAVWVRDLPAGGAPQPPTRLGLAGSDPNIAALLSDDGRAILMWSTRRGGATETYLDYSAGGPRFGAPRLLERVATRTGANPEAGPSTRDSPQLVRLSSESVMASWAGVTGGHWVIRTAPIDQHGLRTISTIAAPAGDALLSALTAGPRGEAIALFTEPEVTADGHERIGRQALMAARGIDAAPGRTLFAAPEQVAPPGPVAGATVAIEPGSDRAVAAWQGLGGAIAYSLRASGPPR
jgi:hypothetical protein